MKAHIALLITIPGNYIEGGWTEDKFDARIPGYGHIERPKQLAAVLVGAVRWVTAR